jgi:twinkle protein
MQSQPSSDSHFLHKEPCPKCGSRDNLGRYSDGHGHCFGCGHYEHGSDHEAEPTTRRSVSSDIIHPGEPLAIPARKLTEETCRKWGYTVGELSGKKVQIANYRNTAGQIVGQKVRFPNKDFLFLGDIKEAGLYGQHLWRNGGRKVVITEGEIDALSVSQAQDNKWPVVSVPNGARGAKKAIQRELRWLEEFEEVVLMFDEDEEGRAAAQECAGLFRPGKCKLARLPMKDANELLKSGKTDEIINAIWGAKSWRPDGVKTIADIRDKVLIPPEQGFPWFIDELTTLTFGRRLGEIYAFGAGTGIGKTDFLTEQIQYDIVRLNEPVGLFMLEQQPVETVKRIAGKTVGKRFHVPDGSWETSELIEALDSLERSGRMFLYDSFGATDWEIIQNTIRFLAHSEGVRIFYLDHLTALAAAEDDERTALERIMSDMGSLVKELGIIIHLVSHLATPDGKPHEEGGRVMIRHFRGSRAIGFWCPFMFGLEREQQVEDETRRAVTTFRVLKDRFTGQSTGKVIHLGYDAAIGRLYALNHDPFADNQHQPNEEESPF